MVDMHSFIDDVKNRTDIAQIVGRYIPLGASNKAKCPFHGDTSPSLSVNQQEQYFYCFGCGKGGDVFRFLELHQGMTFMEALKQLAGEAGLAIPGMTEEDQGRLAADRLRLSILNETALYHHQQITPEAISYLVARGFSEDLIRDYRLGFGDGTLAEHLIDGKKFAVEACLEAGVLDKVGTYFGDYFAGRIVFPITKRGQVVYLTSRALGDAEPRHRHLKGEVHHLFNEDALRHDAVVLTEGIPDCLSVIQAGYPAVAVLGVTSFKPEYIERFSNCKVVYIAMDNDAPGRKAALEIGSMLGKKARIVELTDVNDLNDYFRVHLPAEFKLLLESSKDIIRHRIFQIPEGTDKIDLPALLDPVLKDLSMMEKPQAESYLGRSIKERFGLTPAEVVAYRSKLAEYRRELDEGKPVITEDGKAIQMCARFEGLVDLVDDDGEVAFLVKEDGELKVRSQVEKDGKLLVPPRKDCIRWQLARAGEVQRHYTSESMLSGRFGADLYHELVEYHRSISELPNDTLYGFLACWVMHTYMQEHVQYSPILCFSALPARGKTRTGKGIIYVSYRGFYENSLREPNVIRFASYFGSTGFFDMKDFWKKAVAAGSEDVFLGRYEKGGRVTRVLYPDKGPFEDMTSFEIFSPTIIGTNEAIDDILESRCVTLSMRETHRRFEADVLEENSLHLREKLLAFRAKHMDSGLPDVDAKPAASRLGDILRPIYQIVMLVNPEGKELFLQLVGQIEEEKKMTVRNGFEAQIVTAIIALEPRVERGILAVKEITDTYNADKPERYHISPHRVARVLKSMGFYMGHIDNGSAGIVWDQGVVDDLRHRFGI